jgi:hypothetical protein
MVIAQAASQSVAMSTQDLFWNGAIGGFIATVVVYVLPGVIRLAHRGVYGGAMTPARVLGIVLLTVILSAIGGVAPFIATERPEDAGAAIVLGIGSLAAIKALIAAAQDAAA